MSINELTKEQMTELKQNYYCERHDDASYGELADIDFLVSDDEIIEVYGSTDFSPDDFFCSAGDTNLFVVRFIRTDDGAHEEYYYTKYKDAIFHFGLFLNDDSDLYREIQLVNLCESVI